METIRHKLPDGEIRCDFCNRLVKSTNELLLLSAGEFDICMQGKLVRYEAGHWGACDSCQRIVLPMTDDRISRMLDEAKKHAAVHSPDLWLITWLGFFGTTEDPCVEKPQIAWRTCMTMLSLVAPPIVEKHADGRTSISVHATP